MPDDRSASSANPGEAEQSFAARLRNRERILGYWSVLDAPVAIERIARLGYDYVCVDMQHGLVGYSGLVASLTAIDAAGASVGMVRVEANDPTPIGRALDAGAVGVIVPLIDSAEDAARAVSAARYPPLGRRSYGPMRSGLRIGPEPAVAHAETVVLAMIETPLGLSEVDKICATPGLDGVYVGPSDLRLAVGGAHVRDTSVDEVFEEAVRRVRESASAAGIAAGIHTPDGATAARRLAEGYTFATVASDVVHLEQAARAHLDVARGTEGGR